MFLQAMIGWDIISAIFGNGKEKAFDANRDLHLQ